MNDKKSFKLLCVGNSFSDNATYYAYEILRSFGYENIVIGNLYIPGCTLATHINNAENDLPAYIYRKNTTGSFVNTESSKISTAIADGDWDYMTMQQGSPDSGDLATYEAGVGRLYDLLKKELGDKNPTFGWHMTWAYAKGSDHNAFPKYGCDQERMYRQILECVEKTVLPFPGIEKLIPAGTAIQNARTSYIGEDLTSDGFHLNEVGKFIDGVTLIAALTGKDPDEMDEAFVPACVLPHLPMIKESVKNALKNPMSVTKSVYTEA